MTDTPETDAAKVIFSASEGDTWVHVGFAQKLERERNEAWEKIEKLKIERDQALNKLQEYNK